MVNSGVEDFRLESITVLGFAFIQNLSVGNQFCEKKAWIVVWCYRERGKLRSTTGGTDDDPLATRKRKFPAGKKRNNRITTCQGNCTFRIADRFHVTGSPTDPQNHSGSTDAVTFIRVERLGNTKKHGTMTKIQFEVFSCTEQGCCAERIKRNGFVIVEHEAGTASVFS